MTTFASTVAFGITQGWLHHNPPLYTSREPKRISKDEQKRRNRACMQRLRDERRAIGLTADGKKRKRV